MFIPLADAEIGTFQVKLTVRVISANNNIAKGLFLWEENFVFYHAVKDFLAQMFKES